MTKIKICGIRDAETAKVCADAGADMIGLVFYEPSPRSVTLDQAEEIVNGIDNRLHPVGLFVDPDDALLERATRQVPFSLLQLHGSETPARVAEIRNRFRLPVMKAIPIATADDLLRARDYEAMADWLVFDAKPSPDATLPGGNGQAFDWTLLAGMQWKRPWMLSGGLNAGNVAEAIRITGAKTVDVSSGVEDTPGVKSMEKIVLFTKAAKDTS